MTLLNELRALDRQALDRAWDVESLLASAGEDDDIVEHCRERGIQIWRLRHEIIARIMVALPDLRDNPTNEAVRQAVQARVMQIEAFFDEIRGVLN